VQTGAVVRCIVFVVLAAGCSSSAPDRGVPLPACTACGSGALVGGRLFAPDNGIAVANRNGVVLREAGDQVVWLGDGFTTQGWQTFDQGILDVGLDDTGDAAVAVGTDDCETAMSGFGATLVAFGADRDAVWRDDLGTVYQTAILAVTPDVILVTIVTDYANETIRGVPITSPTVALRTSDGSVAWQQDLLGAAAAPDGSLVVAGSFSGTLDLGGTAPSLTSTGTAVYAGALDPATGEGRWASVVDADIGSGLPNIDALATGPSGEVAMAWRADLDAPAGSLAMLDATGNVEWTQPLAQPITSLVTDGDAVVAADREQTSFAEYSMAGLDWQRPVTTTGQDTPAVLAFSGGQVIASISTVGGTAPPPDSTTVGDVTYAGDGLAVFDLAP
jgi:hypothetical protein